MNIAGKRETMYVGAVLVVQFILLLLVFLFHWVLYGRLQHNSTDKQFLSQTNNNQTFT